ESAAGAGIWRAAGALQPGCGGRLSVRNRLAGYADLLQVYGAEFQLRLFRHAADSADGQVIGGVAVAVEIAPVERDKNHSLGHAAPQPRRQLYRSPARRKLDEIPFLQG